jgi:hypothetical protein
MVSLTIDGEEHDQGCAPVDRVSSSKPAEIFIEYGVALTVLEMSSDTSGASQAEFETRCSISNAPEVACRA